jgi:hypothetical protein
VSSPAVACRCRNWVWRCVPVFDFLGDLVEPDGRLDGFLLREEQFLMRGPFGVGEPVVEQIAGDAAGDPAITRLPPGAQLVFPYSARKSFTSNMLPWFCWPIGTCGTSGVKMRRPGRMSR